MSVAACSKIEPPLSLFVPLAQKMDPAKKRAVLERQLQDANKLAGSKLKKHSKGV